MLLDLLSLHLLKHDLAFGSLVHIKKEKERERASTAETEMSGLGLEVLEPGMLQSGSMFAIPPAMSNRRIECGSLRIVQFNF